MSTSKFKPSAAIKPLRCSCLLQFELLCLNPTMLNARQHFPGLLDKVFLDAACVSLAPRPAVDAIQKFLDLAMVCPHESSTAHHIFMDEMRAAARPAVARLINAHDDEIALVEHESRPFSSSRRYPSRARRPRADLRPRVHGGGHSLGAEKEGRH